MYTKKEPYKATKKNRIFTANVNLYTVKQELIFMQSDCKKRCNVP